MIAGEKQRIRRLVEQVVRHEDQRLLDASYLAAATIGQTEVVARLLRGGARIDAKHINGSTALHAAALVKDSSCTRYLLNSGADAANVTVYSYTPVDGAAMQGARSEMSLRALTVRHLRCGDPDHHNPATAETRETWRSMVPLLEGHLQFHISASRSTVIISILPEALDVNNTLPLFVGQIISGEMIHRIYGRLFGDHKVLWIQLLENVRILYWGDVDRSTKTIKGSFTMRLEDEIQGSFHLSRQSELDG